MFAAALLSATSVHAQTANLETASTEAPLPLAHVDNVEGNVLVNRGAGFAELTGSVALAEGDRIALGGEAAARITYAAGCVSELSGSQILTISGAGCASTEEAPALRQTPIADIQPAQAIGMANIDTNPAFWGWAGLTGIVALLMIFHDELFDDEDQTTIITPPPPVSP